MPQVKDRSALTKKALEKRYELALKGLDTGILKSLQKASEAYDLRKSSLGHRRIGRRSRQEAHQEYQIFSPAAEKAIVRWILKLDDFGMPPRLDYLMDSVMAMAKEERFRQVQV
jgi:hypothetical protein